MKIYKYIYYKLFRMWLNKKVETENAPVNAVITLTFLIYINIFSILLILVAIFRKEIINLPSPNTFFKLILVGILVLGGFINYLLLARNSRHIKIIEEFCNETDQQNKRGSIIVLLYIVISFGIPLYILLFTPPI